MQIIEIIACPDCKGSLGEININHELRGFFCDSCGIVFPIEDNVPILLPIRARRYDLEYHLIDNIRQEAESHSMRWLTKCTEKMLNLVNLPKNKTSWEWEEEEHWDKIYTKESKAVTAKKWNDRIWQREFLVEHLANQTSLKGKIILDVGCGEGQNFILLMRKYCDEATLYVATDISLSGLKLNRSRNPHKNSLYILCSADSLPFQTETIDILCYFGILHHTERKTVIITDDSRLLKKGGYILIHEALSRPSPSLLPGFLKPRDEQSAHEEYIDSGKLATVIKENNLEILALKNLNTIFYTGMMKLLGNIMVNNKTLFIFVSMLDSVLMKVLGLIIPYFRAGSIMLLLRRS